MRIIKKLAKLFILMAILYVVILILYEIIDYQNRLYGFNELIYYYGIPLSILLLLVTSLRMSGTNQVILVLVFIPVVSALYATELFMVISPPFTNALAAKNNALPFDTRSRLEIIEQLETEGINAYPAINVNINHRLWNSNGRKILPLGGISNALTVLCNECGEYTIYQSDEIGFHNPKGLYGIEDVEIVALGDSFTQGNCVKSEENAVAIIRNYYPHTINLGLSGAGPLQMLATLKEYAAPLKPKIVLWNYFEGNDLKELNMEKTNLLLLNYLQKGYNQSLISIQSDIDQKLKEFVELKREKIYKNNKQENNGVQYSLLDFLFLDKLRTRLGLYYKRSKAEKTDLDLFQDILVSAQNITASWGGKLYFVYLPQIERFKGFRDRYQINPHRDRVLNLIEDLEILIIDVHNTFANHEDPLSLFPFRRGYHYNEEGYKYFAETVFKFIEKDNARITDLKE